MLYPRNIQAVISTHPDYLGFIFYPGSKRYVGENPDESIFCLVPREIKKVGVFVDEAADKILEIAVRHSLHVIQLHGDEGPGCCAAIRSAGFSVIKAFGMEAEFDFDKLAPYVPVCDFFLFDSKSTIHGGSGVRFKWDILRRYNHDVPFFLSGGIGPEDIFFIRKLQHQQFFAVDINSRFETEPGIKNIEMVDSFITEINYTAT